MYHSLLDYYAISTYYGKELAQMCEIYNKFKMFNVNLL